MNRLDRLVKCTDCSRCVGKRCTNPQAAGIRTTARTLDLGRDLATMPQDCPGFKPRAIPTQGAAA